MKIKFVNLKDKLHVPILLASFMTLLSCMSSNHLENYESANSPKQADQKNDLDLDVPEKSSVVNANNETSNSKNKNDNSVAATTTKTNDSGSNSDFTNAIRSNDEANVLREGAKLLNQNSKNVKVLNAMAMFYFKKGRLPLAKLYLSKALAAANDKSSEIYNNLGIIHISEGEIRDALIAFKKGYQINSQDPSVAANLGNLYAEGKDYKKARVALESAYKGGVKTIPTLNNYAISLVADGRIDDAGRIYKSLVDQNSSDVKIQLNYAIYLVDHKKDYSSAQEVIDKIRFMGISPENRKLIDSLETKVQSGRK